MGRIAILIALLGGTAVSASDLALPEADAVFPEFSDAEIKLGQLLFYDPILSGSKEVSCASCHHPSLGTSDGLSLGLGDGAHGLGPERRADPDNLPEQRVPRNATALFNIGAPEFTVMFHDGRLEADASRPSGLRTPLEDEMVMGFDSVLSAQTMFPVLSPDEMAGHYTENDVARAVRQGFLTHEGGAWDIIASRVDDVPEYRERFDQVIGTDAPIRFTDISNALAAFITFEWRADDSPFDQFLRGGDPLPAEAVEGMALFYGEAGCSGCHSGQFQTDHRFHAIAMPQFGPGKAERFETHAKDIGRMRVTGDPSDAYKFRTPPLRNITMTAPYGHDGAYATLEAVVRHHLDPVSALQQYDITQAALPRLPNANDERVLSDPDEMAAIEAANELKRVKLPNDKLDQIIAFLETLTDPVAEDGRLGVPESVPSGLPVDQ
ncbi:cytochrome-c peroxidase [Qingshengfaniella alkalisoli]|uniref:Cytochrome-c peroxidase n=1 Tax=Qingshengfaniella alkalisoli TaxID=2599296 RepID=A0A5B8J2L9_9RHOB|nr:cytochrome c peroxidase [Qingshengfaniella alkalisoli]QDY68500.1 cytochrome-c peroxidase [Qingshengfaniella alkalisoli]